MIDYKRNQLFFHYNRTRFWNIVSYVSYVFFAAAVIVFILFGGWLPPALPFAIVGVILFLFSISMVTSEKQIKQQIALLAEGAREAALEQFGYPDQNPDLFFVFEGYDIASEGLLYRKKRNGRTFSSVYAITYFMIEKDVLRLWGKRASLVEEDMQIITRDLPLTSLGAVTETTLTFSRTCIDGKTHDLIGDVLTLTNSDGQTLCTVPCKSRDYDMDRFCETLEHHIRRAKGEKE